MSHESKIRFYVVFEPVLLVAKTTFTRSTVEPLTLH